MTGTDRHEHWDAVYTGKSPTDVSWYQHAPAPSLRALAHAGAVPASSLVDVGGGASNLVDALLAQGWQDLTVLDIAAPALDTAKARLGHLADMVNWVAEDITEWVPERTFDVWHDRAVFHFLTEQEQREAYQRALLQGTAKGSHVIIATFALDGPEKCSGLPVQRYDAAGLARQLGDRFELTDTWLEDHVTPWGAVQSFNWCLFRRIR